MELVSVGPPSTPTRAASAGPSPPRRNPMEDADSSVTRKRPRLDSGDRAHRSMSADRIISTPPALGSAQAPFTPPRGEISPKTARLDATFSSRDRTPSKVTINLRDPPQIVSPTVSISNGTHLPAPSDRNGARTPSQTESSTKIETHSTDVISLTSTPTRSPEIEIAEVEDINQEPGVTRWRPLTRVLDAKEAQMDLLDLFPCGDRHPSLRNTVTLLSNAFEKSKQDICEWVQRLLIDL